MVPDSPGIAEISAAAQRLHGRVLATPVISRRSFNEWLGTSVFFKAESFQRSGSFKYRGATNAVLLLDPAQREAGVATHSSGNHGAALALAAREAEIPAHVVVPQGANPEKCRAIAAYGGRIIESGPTLAEREAALEAVCARTGASFIPPYDHAHIIAGQATVAWELCAAQKDLDEIWVPVGGGGLASGTLLAVAAQGGREQPVQVIGVEPELADDAYWSLQIGRIQPQRPPRTVADGLRTALGQLPFEIFMAHALTIRTVSEAEILAAQQLLWQRLKLVVEPSGAVPLAGLLAAVKVDPDRYRSRKAGVILSGGNATFPGDPEPG